MPTKNCGSQHKSQIICKSRVPSVTHLQNKACTTDFLSFTSLRVFSAYFLPVALQGKNRALRGEDNLGDVNCMLVLKGIF